MQEIKIADIANGGAANGGQDIFFDVKTDDVQEYRVLCPYGEVGALIAKLQLFAQLAQHDRTRLPTRPGQQEPLEAVPLLNHQGIEVCAMTDGTGIALRIWMSRGVSLNVPIPAELVPRLRQSMSKRLRQAKQLYRGQKH